MTLVLASCCVDGVVLIADRKFTVQGTLTFIKYGVKLSGVLRNIIFGYSGSEIGYEIFVRYAVGDLIILRDDPDHYTDQNMIQKFCKIMDQMREFRGNTFTLNVVIARMFPMNRMSDLFLVRAGGDYQQISQWIAIGNSDFIADKIIRRFWDGEMKMKDFAELGYCIIKHIEKEQLDLSVGVGNENPSIKYLKDGWEIDTEPDDKEFSQFENAYGSYKEKFKRIKF